MGMLAPERQPAHAVLRPEPFRLVGKRQDIADTWTLELEAESGRGFPFAPGQFTMLSCGGSGEVPISISGDPRRPERLVQTIREVGLATAALIAAPPGTALGVRGPFGRGWPLESAEGDDVVIAAGGIGLPPLRGAILELLDRRDRYRRLILLYGGRSPDQLLFVEELEEWARSGLEVFTTVDTAGPEWLGHIGVVTRLVHRANLEGPRTHAMSCGPEIMMRFVVSELEALGVAAERIHVSMERNMQCGVGHCGHCQLGSTLICRDGPVYPWSEIGRWLAVREL